MGTKHSEECKGGEDCHDNMHLCKIVGKKDFDLLRDLVKESMYLCRKCGRTARNELNLCKPEDI